MNFYNGGNLDNYNNYNNTNTNNNITGGIRNIQHHNTHNNTPRARHDIPQRPPHVFVIDWDGTIAGHVDYQSQYYNILSALRKHGFKPHVTNIIPHAFSPKAKLIRPGFTSWMKALKELYKDNGDAHFFIYTASERKWALQEIAWVEKLHGIKFDKPIFTRDDCTIDNSGNIRKSLTKVFPKMMRSISKQRGSSLSPEQRTVVLKNYTMIIDNNAVWLDHTDKLLLCPDYGYTVFENLINVIPKEARTHPSIQQMIMSLMNSGYICSIPIPKNTPVHNVPHLTQNSHDDHSHDKGSDGMKELMKQYMWLALKCKKLCTSNEQYIHDDFWKYMKKIFISNKIQLFTPSIVKQLQNASWKRVKLVQK